MVSRPIKTLQKIIYMVIANIWTGADLIFQRMKIALFGYSNVAPNVMR